MTMAQNFAEILVTRNKLHSFVINEATKVALEGNSELIIELSNFENIDYVKHYVIDVLKFEFAYENKKFLVVGLNDEYIQLRDFRLKLEIKISNLAADAIDSGKDHVEFDVEDNKAAKVALDLLTEWGFKVSNHETHMKISW